MANIPWEKWADRLFIVLVMASALFWASRNSDPSKVVAVEQKLDGIVADVNKFGQNITTRVQALEQAVVPTNPAPVKK